MQSNTVVSEGDFIIQLFVTTQFLYIVLRNFTWHYSGASARQAAPAIENGNLYRCEKIWLCRQRTPVRPVRTGREGRVDSEREER